MASANSNDQSLQSGTQSGNSCRAIFISYRRSDTEGEAGRLYDDLVRAYSDDSVFMDVTGIQPGLDFRKAIDSNIAGCGVLLAVIGPNWATATDSSGNQRIANPSDYVRLEIASALAKQIPVIPVLVHGAHMPPLEQLPDDLKDLRYRNSVELTHARWNSDVALLIGALKNYVAAVPAHPTETVHATIPVQLPPPIATPAPPSRTNRGQIYAVAIIAFVLVLGLGGYLAMKRNGPATAPQTVVVQPAVDAGVAQSKGGSAKSPAPEPSTAATATPAAVPNTSGVSDPSASSNATFSGFLGEWTNSKVSIKDNDEILAISIVDFAGQLEVRPRGQCPNSVCNWGPKNATIHGLDAVTDAWKLHNTENETKLHRTAAISMRANADGLDVTIHNVFINPDGKTLESFIHRQFVKAQP